MNMNRNRNTSNREDRGRFLRRWLLLALCLMLLLGGVAALSEGGGGEGNPEPPEQNEGPATYNITWQNWNGDTLTTTQVTAGDTPSYNGTPSREPDDDYHYEFAGWDPDPTAAAGDTTYTAKYNASAHTGGTATCQARAECSACGKAYGSLGNHNLTEHQETAKTCTTPGNSAYWSCSDCPKFFSDANGENEIAEDSWVIPASHDLTEHQATAKTCTTAGNTAYWSCSGCPKFFSDANGENEIAENSWVVPASHALPLTKTDYKAPTTTAAGNNAYWTCSACHKVFSDEAGTQETTVEAQTLPMLTIAAFDPVAKQSLTYKPTLDEAKAKLPATLNATLSDNTKMAVNVTWACADYDTGYDRDYTFTASLAAGSPTLGTGVAAPTATLTVAPAKSGDYTYRLDKDGNATIIGWSGSNTDLIVPAQLDGHNVTAIGANAFKGKDKLVTLSIPTGVKSIGDNAFADCTALTKLTLPDTLDQDKVGQNIIQNDAALTSLTLRCTQTTTLNPATTFVRTYTEAGETKTATVVLPTAVTDIAVTKDNVQENPAALTLACDFTVAVDHAITVEERATLTNSATTTNNGTIANNGGTITNNGTIYSCAGTVTGTISGAGTYKANGQHNFDGGKCTICKAELPKLSIKYKGKKISKVYDKTNRVFTKEMGIKASDFVIEGLPENMDVRIAGFVQSTIKNSNEKVDKFIYDSHDVGKHKATAYLMLEGNDAELYGKQQKVTVSGTIEPKALIITPSDNQKKTYGASDPTKYTGKVRGLLSGDSIKGKLARETGENAGKYRILQGTIDAGENYDVQVVEKYFVIEPKSINSSDVGLVTIGNQRYTGEKVEPTISLRFGKNTLKEGTDFKAEFKDNIQPGQATVKLTGLGNYNGTRETSFRILNIAGGVDTSTSSGGGGGYSYGGFDDGETESDEDYEEGEEVESDEGKLLLNGSDYGTILFDGESMPAPFVQFAEKIEPETEATLTETEPAPEEWRLTIIADPLVDEQTGETLMLDDGEREQFDELHLRLTTPLLDTLTGLGFTEIVYELENAEVIIPLATLSREIELENAPVEVVGTVEGEAVDEETAVEESVDELEVELAPTTIQIDAYDICVEQSEVLVLTERENGVLDEYDALAPAYRVRVYGVLESEDVPVEVQTVVNEDGETVVELPVAEKLPEGGYPQALTLRLLPLENLEEAPVDALAVYVSTIEAADDPDVIEVNPAVFVDVDGMIYAEMAPRGDGLYIVGRPAAAEGEPEGDAEDEEGDFEDFDDLDGGGSLTSGGSLNTIGGTFHVDENGNQVFD